MGKDRCYSVSQPKISDNFYDQNGNWMGPNAVRYEQVQICQSYAAVGRAVGIPQLALGILLAGIAFYIRNKVHFPSPPSVHTHAKFCIILYYTNTI